MPPLLGYCLLWLMLLTGARGASQEAQEAQEAQLTLLYRRLLLETAPRQLELQDALGITWRSGFLIGSAVRSQRQAVFDGAERDTFSYISAVMNPEQRGERGMGWWVRNDRSDVILVHHYGPPVKVHTVSADGAYSSWLLGVPLGPGSEDARPHVLVPRGTYASLESLSREEFTLHSFIDVPAWDVSARRDFSPEDMKTKYPQHAELFICLATPGCRRKPSRTSCSACVPQSDCERASPRPSDVPTDPDVVYIYPD